jgi:hypothetical protein
MSDMRRADDMGGGMSTHHGQTVPLGQALGDEHPLCRAEAELRAAVAQLGLTALFVAGCAIIGGPGTFTLVLIGGMALLVLTLRTSICLDTRRQEAMELIASGHEAIPVPVVRRARRELLRHRRFQVADRLSMALEDALAYAQQAPPPVDDLALIAVRDELVEVIELLRADDVDSARSVVLADRLLAPGESAVARRNVMALRIELGRIRYLLRETRSDAAGARG